jgi:hypothetical protein
VVKVLFALGALALVALPVKSQTIVDRGVDDRVEALNAIFAFRNDLSKDSTIIARCTIPTALGDTGTVRGLELRFQRLLAPAIRYRTDE